MKGIMGLCRLMDRVEGGEEMEQGKRKGRERRDETETAGVPLH